MSINLLPQRYSRPMRGALLVAALACALAPATHASVDAAAPPAAALPSVADIVARNARARGGPDAWKSVQSLVERGHIEHGQIKGPKARHGNAAANSGGALDKSVPFILQIKRPNKMRLEISLGDLTALQLFDGSRGWTVQPTPQGPLVRQFSDDEAAAASEQLDPEGPLLGAADRGTTVALDGEETVEGHRAFKLSLTLKSGLVRHLWIDAQTYLDLKIDGSRLVDGRIWPAQTYFYDWRKSGGLQLPYRQETAINDVRSTNRIIVERVYVNAPLADDAFTLPPVQHPAPPPPASATPQPPSGPAPAPAATPTP